MKRFKEFKTMTSLPIEKYPINYKCTFIYDIKEKLESKGLSLNNLQPGVETRNKYHDFNFYDFMNKKLPRESTIFPNLTLSDENKNEFNYELTENGSVILIPRHYDSSNDEETHRIEKEKGRNRLIDNFKQLYSGDKLKDMIDSIDKHVNFGVSSFEWVNIALDAIYEEYKQYYVNGFLRVHLPFDWDYDNSLQYNQGENTSHGYPIEKMLFLSDIEEYLKTNYDLSDELFYDWILNNTYNEGRYWETPLSISFNEDFKFSRGGGKYGMESTPTIDKMLGILETEYSELLKERSSDECIYVFMDYYKKVNEK